MIIQKLNGPLKFSGLSPRQMIKKRTNATEILFIFLLKPIPSEIIGAVRSGRPLRAHSLTYTTSFYLTIIGRWILSILSATNISFSVNKYKSLLNKRKSQLLI